MKNVLVTGGKGQLAASIKDSVKDLEGFKFIYVDLDELDITKLNEVMAFFDSESISYCINCAAYTNVDRAESEAELAKMVNEVGAQNLAEVCSKNKARLIQISTDFVFDGKKSLPYSEEDVAKPLGVYGLTKLNGEYAVLKTLPTSFVIRTSWLYSEHGNNFLKTMLRLGSEREQLNIIYDQIGTPTYAADLARVIVKIIIGELEDYGVYHYSNEGVASWYDFAKAIFDASGTKVKLSPIRTEAYPTPAKRPSFSVMDKSKIKDTFQLEIPHWSDSLHKCLENFKTKR